MKLKRRIVQDHRGGAPVPPRVLPQVAGRTFTSDGFLCRERAVCKRCHTVMQDSEPYSVSGLYHHPEVDRHGKPYRCINAGLSFTQRDTEVEPFLRKRERARNRRNGVRP